MNRWLPRLGVLVFGLLAGSAAFAQSASVVGAGSTFQLAPGAPPPPPMPPPPGVAAPRPAPPSGRWINTADHGWIWAPSGTTAVNLDGVPYTYLYTPTYGWNWYVSPWGWGPYRRGAWEQRSWRPAGPTVWVAPPSVRIRLGPSWRR
jgi:hypothetical protein